MNEEYEDLKRRYDDLNESYRKQVNIFTNCIQNMGQLRNRLNDLQYLNDSLSSSLIQASNALINANGRIEHLERKLNGKTD